MKIGVKILVVEDSPTQAEQLKYILENDGYQVVVAYNGKEALDYITKHKPVIVISDIIMPEMSGYELCQRIKTDESLKNIPVILLTALSNSIDIIRGLKCGADNFITKPFNSDFLLSRIKHILINKKLRKKGLSEMGLEVYFAGQKHHLTSERMQIIDLLLSTFENAVQKNLELEQANKELKKALEIIKNLETNYRTLLERNVDAIIVVDQAGIVLYVNPAAEAFFKTGTEEFLGKRFDFPMVAGETKEVEIIRGNGEILVAEMRVAKTIWEGQKSYLASLRDVTENVKLREKLRNLSITDELTGLYNRRGFLTLAQQQLKIADRLKSELALLFADLDNMKSINDTLGHQNGDLALIKTAKILKETFRETDIIARVGGDEFALIFQVVSKPNQDLVLNRLQKNLDVFNAKGELPCKLSLSVGMANYDPADSCSVNELLARADRSMYEAKKKKINQEST